MSEPKTFTLEAPGAVLNYDVRDNGGAGHPVLLLAGAPMGASGFAALAEQFADRTVVTYDPRGTERSQRTDGQPPGSVPTEHAEDLRRLIEAQDAGPADVFSSSRRRGQRAGPGGRPSPAGPHPGGARAARRPGAARP
jgi:pimeloyl-ACP methyl ester carboxylesterase